jgi:hypothetical protein
MADLKQAADKFLDDLIAQNVAGLMGTFTPSGMTKAMGMGQPDAPSGTPTKREVVLGDADGEAHPVTYTVGNADGELSVATVWKEVDGIWKVDDIELKS